MIILILILFMGIIGYLFHTYRLGCERMTYLLSMNEAGELHRSLKNSNTILFEENQSLKIELAQQKKLKIGSS